LILAIPGLKAASITKGVEKTGIFTYRRLTLDPNLSLCTNINYKWIKDLNIIYEIVKLLEYIGKYTGTRRQIRTL
jgi:hypothetical protein